MDTFKTMVTRNIYLSNATRLYLVPKTIYLLFIMLANGFENGILGVTMTDMSPNELASLQFHHLNQSLSFISEYPSPAEAFEAFCINAGTDEQRV